MSTLSVGFIDRTATSTTMVPAQALLRERRVIMLNREISTETANTLIEQLLILNLQSDKPITLILNSPGGDIQAGLALIDTMDSCTCPIHTVVLGMAASMAAVVLAAGTQGMRICSPNSRAMIHEPLLSGGVGGSCSSIQAIAKSISERKILMNTLLAQYTGRSIDEVDQATSYDHYMSAEEALEFGLVDHICSGAELMHILKGVNTDDLS